MYYQMLTHCGLVTLAILFMVPNTHQAITWMMTEHLTTNFSEIWINIPNIFIEENKSENVVGKMLAI